MSFPIPACGNTPRSSLLLAHTIQRCTLGLHLPNAGFGASFSCTGMDLLLLVKAVALATCLIQCLSNLAGVCPTKNYGSPCPQGMRTIADVYPPITQNIYKQAGCGVEEDGGVKHFPAMWARAQYAS